MNQKVISKSEESRDITNIKKQMVGLKNVCNICADNGQIPSLKNYFHTLLSVVGRLMDHKDTPTLIPWTDEYVALGDKRALQMWLMNLEMESYAWIIQVGLI